MSRGMKYLYRKLCIRQWVDAFQVCIDGGLNWLFVAPLIAIIVFITIVKPANAEVTKPQKSTQMTVEYEHQGRHNPQSIQ